MYSGGFITEYQERLDKSFLDAIEQPTHLLKMLKLFPVVSGYH